MSTLGGERLAKHLTLIGSDTGYLYYFPVPVVINTPERPAITVLVETAGVEPASANPPLQNLHA